MGLTEVIVTHCNSYNVMFADWTPSIAPSKIARCFREDDNNAVCDVDVGLRLRTGSLLRAASNTEKQHLHS